MRQAQICLAIDGTQYTQLVARVCSLAARSMPRPPRFGGTNPIRGAAQRPWLAQRLTKSEGRVFNSRLLRPRAPLLLLF